MRRAARLRAALRRRPSGAPATRDPRIERLVERVERLEDVVEGLQDAIYRDARRQDENIQDLRARTEPGEIARALSEDARKRGL